MNEQTLKDIVNRVAKQLDVSQELTHKFVSRAFDDMTAQLDAGRSVRIRGLGLFAWTTDPARPYHQFNGKPYPLPEGNKLRFTPAAVLRGRRRTEMAEMQKDDNEGMTKYAVVTDNEKTKEAKAGVGKSTCPVCDAGLDSAGACPAHGTEPFEPTHR